MATEAADPLVATADYVESPTSPSAFSFPPFPSESPPPSQGRLYALGDLHLSFKGNREALEALSPHPNDSLILCGDIGETPEHLSLAFKAARSNFKTVFWTVGNHELYTLPSQQEHGLRGEAKYMECVKVARQHGVITPEDPYTLWEGDGGPVLVCPVFTLYDYTFRPDEIKSEEEAIKWAKEENIEATDEVLLHPDPYPSRSEWCSTLVQRTETRLKGAIERYPDIKLCIVNHWPLRHDLVQLFLVPRFSIWCGTKLTEDWHTRFNAKVIVSGHCHVRRTDWKDRVRFEECSLGYPRQWQECKDRGMDMNDMLREILPGPDPPPGGEAETKWRRYG